MSANLVETLPHGTSILANANATTLRPGIAAGRFDARRNRGKSILVSTLPLPVVVLDSSHKNNTLLSFQLKCLIYLQKGPIFAAFVGREHQQSRTIPLWMTAKLQNFTLGKAEVRYCTNLRHQSDGIGDSIVLSITRDDMSGSAPKL